MNKKVTPTLWAGFVEGQIHLEPEPRLMNDHYGMLYKTRAEARKYYQDVRRVRVKITEVKK